MAKLPAQAQIYVDGITADLERTRLLVEGHMTDEASFTLMQTKERYLPDILRAYEAIPGESRGTTSMNDAGRTADDILVAQLKTLAWATRKAAETIIREKGQELVVNERFIADKFPDQETNGNYAVVKQQAIEKLPSYLTEKKSEEEVSEDFNSDSVLKFAGIIVGFSALVIYPSIFMFYMPAEDYANTKAEIAVMESFDGIDGFKDGEVLPTNPHQVIIGIDEARRENVEKPGQYKIKRVGREIIIIDRQEHASKSLRGLPKEGGGTCAKDCWHLEYKDGKAYGRT